MEMAKGHMTKWKWLPQVRAPGTGGRDGGREGGREEERARAGNVETERGGGEE